MPCTATDLSKRWKVRLLHAVTSKNLWITTAQLGCHEWRVSVRLVMPCEHRVLRAAQICVHHIGLNARQARVHRSILFASQFSEKRAAPPKANSSICCFQAGLLWHVALSGCTRMSDHHVSLQWTEPNWPHPLMTHPGCRTAWVWVRSAKGKIKSVGDGGWGQSYYVREGEKEGNGENNTLWKKGIKMEKDKNEILAGIKPEINSA